MRNKKNLTLIIAVAALALLFLVWIFSGSSHVVNGYAQKLDQIVKAAPEKRAALYNEVAEEYVPKFSDIMNSKSNTLESKKYALHQVMALSPHMENPTWGLGASLLFMKDNFNGGNNKREWEMLENMILACLPNADANETVVMQRMLGAIAQEAADGLAKDYLAVYPLTYADYVLAGAKNAPETDGQKIAKLAAARYFRTDSLEEKKGTPFELETNVKITHNAPTVMAEIKSNERMTLAKSVENSGMLGKAQIEKVLGAAAQTPTTTRFKIEGDIPEDSETIETGVVEFTYLKDCGRSVRHDYNAEYILNEPKKNEQAAAKDILSFTGLEDFSTFIFNDLSNAETVYKFKYEKKAQ